jgi:DNA repair exonuclease SbcCD ATPase subunit/ABC-type amino acid transport system permease subunit
MILHRLRMQNYRVFEELTEVEFGAGLIGIHGANGAGKSSLIGAIPWALYGRSPTKVGLARTTGTQGTCVVELEFEHEGHLYRVVREVAGDLGMPRTQAAAYVDGLQVTTGTKAVTTYVESVLGMSESAFLASVFTEQKQLAAFSNRQPRERAELVVRLLGVKPLDTAIDAARVDMRATEAHARQLAADVGDVEPLQTRVDAARDARVAGERVLELATTAATAAQDAVDAAQRELNDVRAIAMQVNALRERRIAVARDLSRIERQEAELGAELAELESARDELEKLAPRVGDLAAAQEAARLWEAWLTARERVAATAAPAEPDHATLLDATEQARRADAEEVAARAALEEAVSDASSARERQRQLAEMVRRVAQLDRSVPCPSCGQALGESFGQSRRHFSAELDHAAAAATAASKRAEAARTAAAVAAKAASAAREAAAAARAAAERAALVAERRERDVEALTAAAAAVSQAWLEQWGPRPALGLDGLPQEAIFWGCAALVLSYSAYVAEVFRAGIESVHPSQRAAARSLGLTHTQSLRYVIVPQAVRRVLPPLLNDFVSLQKDSGLIAVLGVVDAIRAAQIETARDFNFTPYVVAGVLFVCLTIPMARFTDWLARRQGFQGGGVV